MIYFIVHLLCALFATMLWGFATVIYGGVYTNKELRTVAILSLIGGPITLVYALLNIGDM
jgi:hypothetical protein